MVGGMSSNPQMMPPHIMNSSSKFLIALILSIYTCTCTHVCVKVHVCIVCNASYIAVECLVSARVLYVHCGRYVIVHVHVCSMVVECFVYTVSGVATILREYLYQ